MELVHSGLNFSLSRRNLGLARGLVTNVEMTPPKLHWRYREDVNSHLDMGWTE